MRVALECHLESFEGTPGKDRERSWIEESQKQKVMETFSSCFSCPAAHKLGRKVGAACFTKISETAVAERHQNVTAPHVAILYSCTLKRKLKHARLVGPAMDTAKHSFLPSIQTARSFLASILSQSRARRLDPLQ